MRIKLRRDYAVSNHHRACHDRNETLPQPADSPPPIMVALPMVEAEAESDEEGEDLDIPCATHAATVSSCAGGVRKLKLPSSSSSDAVTAGSNMCQKQTNACGHTGEANREGAPLQSNRTALAVIPDDRDSQAGTSAPTSVCTRSNAVSKDEATKVDEVGDYEVESGDYPRLMVAIHRRSQVSRSTLVFALFRRARWRRAIGCSTTAIDRYRCTGLGPNSLSSGTGAHTTRWSAACLAQMDPI